MQQQQPDYDQQQSNEAVQSNQFPPSLPLFSSPSQGRGEARGEGPCDAQSVLHTELLHERTFTFFSFFFFVFFSLIIAQTRTTAAALAGAAVVKLQKASLFHFTHNDV